MLVQSVSSLTGVLSDTTSLFDTYIQSHSSPSTQRMCYIIGVWGLWEIFIFWRSILSIYKNTCSTILFDKWLKFFPNKRLFQGKQQVITEKISKSGRPDEIYQNWETLAAPGELIGLDIAASKMTENFNEWRGTSSPKII